MPQGWDLGVLGESKALARGFAMAPHQLRILVFFVQEMSSALAKKKNLLLPVTLPTQIFFFVQKMSSA